MSVAEAQPFDLRGPLPSGVTVLEASAGTGKTYTIAALAARYVAEGLELDHLLLITFTRMATGELRERVRERLVAVERGLADPASATDEVVGLLADGTPEEVERRRRNLARAIAGFDAATIVTTHAFCQEVLGGLGLAADLEPGVEFIEDLSDLVEEVVDDLYVRAFHGGGDPPFDRAEAAEIARAAINNPDAPISPAAPGTVAERRRRLAEAVRSELGSRKRAAAVMSFDDLLTRLDGALAAPGGEQTAARLADRFHVVLVDEFQDTDPTQWRIVRRAFGDQNRTLVLIGDPKQAIYAFRGADVYAYLEAARDPDTKRDLRVNWRSDQGLIDAYDELLRGVRLGHEGIVYRQVRAADANQAPRLSGAPDNAPLRFRVVGDAPAVTRTRTGLPSRPSAREYVARDVAAEIVALLDSRARIESRAEDGTPIGDEPVAPKDLAVLVPTNRTAALIRDALEDVGVPAVINGAGSVFGTDPAGEWLRLLEALERPASPPRARSAALTCFLGWSTERVAAADEDDWEEVHRRLHDWARVLRVRGVAALTETISAAEGLPERILRKADGERDLTDLRHVAQLLHSAAAAEHLGVTVLTGWLRRRIAEARDDTGDEERSRRLESDAQAVQVLTVHRAKGLEFPIVYLPYLWEPGYIPRDDGPVFFHDAYARDKRTIDVSLEGPAYRRHRERWIAEQRGEDLRLAYVALTRARHQTVVWWAGSSDSRDSPLGRLLFSRDAEGNVAVAGDRPAEDAAVLARLGKVAAGAAGCVSVETTTVVARAWWSGPLRPADELEAARWDRALDWHWRRTSFSDLTADAYEHRVWSEPEEAEEDDEPVEEPAVGVLSGMPAGVHVGTLIHRVMEATDFTAPDLDAELLGRVEAAQARRRVEIGDPAVLIAGLRSAIETPLGPLAGGVALRELGRADRLDELDFELPLVGGEDPSGQLDLATIAAVLREHLPPGDPFAGYADRLADPHLRASVRGYLTGSLDLVARLPGEVPRFAVVDYKSNWLGDDYGPAALTAEMLRSHYALQALLYTVALHRYLRWRLPGYSVERNLAGVLYLFLRGMTSPESAGAGVFAWTPSPGLVDALSEAFDR